MKNKPDVDIEAAGQAEYMALYTFADLDEL